MIIGLVGFINSGKGTVGDMLAKKGFVQDSFAKSLKDSVAVIFDWPRELLEGDTQHSRSWREEPDKFWSEAFGYPFSPRLALQLMGTEAGRNVFHKDIWVLSLLNRSRDKDVVITDVRFRNEIEHIYSNNGYIVNVRRGSFPVWYDTLASIESQEERENYMKAFDLHSSEWDWVGVDFDFVIENDGSLEQLSNQVDDLINTIR